MSRILSVFISGLVAFMAVGQFAKANTIESVFGINSPVPEDIQTIALANAVSSCADIVQSYGLSVQSTVGSTGTDTIPKQKVDSYIITFFSEYTPDAHPKKFGKILQTIRVSNPVNASDGPNERSVAVHTFCTP